MNFKLRDVVTGFIVVVILIVGIILIFKSRNKFKNIVSVPTTTPNFQQKLEDKFKNFNIPVDSEKIELKDVTGGTSMGVKTQTEVIADLPDLPSGKFYQVWEENNGNLISLGKMKMVKGGYIFSGNFKNKKVVVSQEKIFDNNIEVKILE